MKNFIAHLRSDWYKYALEMIVITMGILGAFALNNWNEILKERQTESSFLNAINEEFKNNKEQLKQITSAHRSTMMSCDSAIALFPISDENSDEILEIILRSGFWTVNTFNPSQTSIESISSSGSFDVFQNQQLRYLLISWEDLVEDYLEDEKNAAYLVKDFLDPFVINRLSMTGILKDKQLIIPSESRTLFENLVISRRGTLRNVVLKNELSEVEQTMDSIIYHTNNFN